MHQTPQPDDLRPNYPSDTVTFIFTDIESSTQLLRELGADRYGALLSDQRAILRAAFGQFNGQEIDTQGDAFFVSIPRATEAVGAAVRIQRVLADHDWSEMKCGCAWGCTPASPG